MRKPTWLFDLDNTLHDASHAIFPAINANMNAFIARTLAQAGLPSDEDAINALRVRYWQRYGATLFGMIKHHGVRSEDFLRDAHDFADLPSMIRAERGLLRFLRRLPGRKILLTNAPRRYSREVLRHLGLQHDFDHHVPIEAMRVHRQWQPKPSKRLLRKLLAQHRIQPRDCILVEDTLANLKSAKTLGMRTVWVTGCVAAQQAKQARAAGQPAPLLTKRPVFVDVKVQSVRQLPNNRHRLR